MRFNRTLLSLLLFLFGSQSNIFGQPNSQTISDDSTSRIFGRVTARGKPLPGAIITLWRQPLAEPIGNNVTLVGSTNSEGNYELTKVPAGNYFISANLSGYVTGKENQIFDNLRRVNAIAKGKIERVDFELVPEGVIRGVVTDESGKPVALVPVSIFTEVTPAGAGLPKYARDLRTDNSGNFRIVGVPAGKYRVAAGYYPVTTATLFGRVGYRRVFYGDTTEESQARPIDVSPGADIKIDLTVGAPVKTFTVSATILDNETEKPVNDMSYMVRIFENGKVISGAGTRGRSNSKGEITSENVAPGEYAIEVPKVQAVFRLNGNIDPTPNIFGVSKHFHGHRSRCNRC